MEEYATSIKSSDSRLTQEVHIEAKEQFEVTCLKRIFKLCIQALEESTKSDIPETILPLIMHLLSICENVLTFGLTHTFNILFYASYMLINLRTIVAPNFID